MPRWSIPVLWLLAALGCGWIALTTPVAADLTLFASRADPVAELLLEQLRSGPTTRLILLGLAGDAEPERAAVSQRLAERLRASGGFARVANGADALPDAELQALFAYRYRLSSTVAPERFAMEGLRAGLQQRLAELQSPLAVFQKRWLAGDPTGELLTLLKQWQGGLREPAKRRGVWFAPDGDRALLLVETRASGYDLAAQQAAVTAIRAAFAAASAGTGVRLEMSGPGVLATLAADTIHAQAEFLGALALAAVVLILLLVYRSARTVWLGALPMLAALLAGAAAVDLIFGKMYLITLAFSMTLLGETLDYPTYLFSHRRAVDTVADTVRQLWPTLRLCVATTMLGCLAMLDADFPGLSQLGVFTVAGIAAAVATTRWLLPALLPPDWTPPRPTAIGPWADRVLQPRRRLALALGGCGALVLLALIVKAPPLWENDLAALSPVPRELLRLDQELRTALGAPEVGHLIAITAPDAETALRHSETMAAYLDERQKEGVLAGYDGAMRYLPSAQMQQQRLALLPEPATLTANLNAALAGLPFKPGLFAPFLDAIAAALLPVGLALVFTVAALLALGERLALFHLVSLLLVLGVGVDYGLFFSRPGADPDSRRRTLHALLVCCGSALTVFGMLSFSALPALRAIGLTVSLGVAASFLSALLAARPLLTKMS